MRHLMACSFKFRRRSMKPGRVCHVPQGLPPTPNRFHLHASLIAENDFQLPAERQVGVECTALSNFQEMRSERSAEI